MNDTAGFVGSFHGTAPYIHYLRDKTLVVGISDNLLSGETLTNLATDLNLLVSLGVHLAVVHGSHTQVNIIAQAHDIEPQYHNHRHITDETVLQYAKQVSGILRSDIGAALCNNASQTPQRSSPPAIASDNFLAAKSLGTIDDIGMGYTGIVRKTDAEAVHYYLDDDAAVLISPLGYSFSDKTFSLSMGEIAEAVAMVLHAEKLVYIAKQEGISDAEECLITNLSIAEACQHIEARQICPSQTRLLLSAVKAVESGIGHTRVLSGRHDGNLIRKLFTRNDTDVLMAQGSFVGICRARSDDIPSIMKMVRPLVKQGILLHRSREYLENHVSSFSVIGHDCRIYGYVALKTFVDPDYGEPTCLVVSSGVHDSGYGEMLLERLFQKAHARRIRKLFALSTHIGEWFAERGFRMTLADGLPEERRRDYMESGRNLRMFVYDLAQSR